MAKKREHRLLWPPRYHSGDLRNLARIPAGILFSMQLAGYDYPIRPLRHHKDSSEVTIPPQVWETLQLEPGDWIIFGVTNWPSVAVISRVPDESSELLDIIKRKDRKFVVRKVTRHRNSLRVVISPAVRKLLSAEPGDSLAFGLTPVSGVISLCAIKGGGDSAGSRRTG